MELCKYVKALFLDQQWSPEEITGRLALEHHKTIISYSTIYREIYASRFDDPHRSHGNRGVVRKLRHRGKNRHTKNRVEIRYLIGGKKFAKHEDVTAALDGVKFYFPKPHRSWERGTNENTNGLLREYFQKGKDITDIPDDYVQEMFDKLNRRPRKCLGYRTPYEIFFSKTLNLDCKFIIKKTPHLT